LQGSEPAIPIHGMHGVEKDFPFRPYSLANSAIVPVTEHLAANIGGDNNTAEGVFGDSNPQSLRDQGDRDLWWDMEGTGIADMIDASLTISPRVPPPATQTGPGMETLPTQQVYCSIQNGVAVPLPPSATQYASLFGQPVNLAGTNEPRQTKPLPIKYDTERHRYINGNKIFRELSEALSRRCDEIIYPTHLFHGDQQIPVDLVDNILCLEEDEWKYLPLWAGGFDDGLGGVFDEVHVPNDDAAGFRGGKRGINISPSRGMRGDGTASESGFDDIASETVSTVGKASKVATDGTATVRSFNTDDLRSDDGFMNQDDVYEVVQAMSMDRVNKGKEKAKKKWTLAEDYDFDGDEGGDDEDGEVSTIMGAGSDVQGDFFGDVDEDDNDVDVDATDQETSRGKEKVAGHDEEDKMDLVVIDKQELR
jgi:hypothetical protein